MVVLKKRNQLKPTHTSVMPLYFIHTYLLARKKTMLHLNCKNEDVIYI